MAATKEEIIEALKEMPALELSELVHELEDVFGVSAAAPVAVAAAPAAETDKSETAGVVAYLKRSVKLRQSFFAASSCVDAARHQSRRLVVAKQRPLLIRTAAARVFTNLLHSHVNDKSGK